MAAIPRGMESQIEVPTVKIPAVVAEATSTLKMANTVVISVACIAPMGSRAPKTVATLEAMSTGLAVVATRVGYIKEYIIPKFKKVPKKITKKEFFEVIDKIKRLWFFYGFAEYPYTDFAYKVALDTNDKKLQKNLNEVAELKLNELRKIMNAYFFKNGVIENILKFISSRSFIF